MPYTWRPNTVLRAVRDTAELWEIGKSSKKDEVQYHLIMALGTWVGRNSRDIASRIPLLDMPTLFVIQDLELFEILFLIFSQVAIVQSTLLEIQRSASHSIFNPLRARFSSLAQILTSYIGKIVQPASANPRDERVTRDTVLGEDVKSLLSGGRFILYSDDAFFRIYATQDEQVTSSLCTLDLLRIADELELLPVRTIAQKIGQLCLWKVQILVEPRFLLASLPAELVNAKTASIADDMIRQDAYCYAILEGIWSVRQKLEDVIRSGATLLRDMVLAKHNKDVVIAGVLGAWLGKVRLRVDAGTPSPVEQLAMVITIAAMTLDEKSGNARQLWSVFRLVVEFVHGDKMDEQKESSAIATLAQVCAQATSIEEEHQKEPHAMTILRGGLTEGTADYDLFTRKYEENRIYEGAASTGKFSVERMEISDTGFQT